jgi:hypothetical protein
MGGRPVRGLQGLLGQPRAGNAVAGRQQLLISPDSWGGRTTAVGCRRSDNAGVLATCKNSREH